MAPSDVRRVRVYGSSRRESSGKEREMKGGDENPESENGRIVESVKDILEQSRRLSSEHVSVAIADGCVHLYGAISSDGGLHEIEEEISGLPGVRSVHIHLCVRPYESAVDLKNRIVDAVVHQACLDALRIAVERRGSEVILGGTVRSRWEEELAVRVASGTPGVGSVVDRIRLRPSG
jgi:osmotically-inducible protein OsmY